MRYWIMDKDDTPQRFPLQRLIRRVCEVTHAGTATCNLFRVTGYGMQVHELEKRLDVEDVVTVQLSTLDQLSQGTEEWFYDLEAQLPGTEIRFGLHDSTALFVEGSSEIVEDVVAAFELWKSASP
jgi:hypothetical protein